MPGPAFALVFLCTLPVAAEAPSPSLLPAIEQLQLGDQAAAVRALEPAAAAGNPFAIALRAPQVPGDTSSKDLPSPRTPEERLARAELWLASRHPNEALEALGPLLAAPPAAVTKAVARAGGRAALLAGRYEDAERWLTPVASGEAATSLALARALYRQGEAQRATEVLAPFVAALLGRGPPERPIPPGVAAQILLEHGRIAIAAGRAGDAVQALARVVEMEPANGTAWQALAQAQRLAGDKAGAETALAHFRELAKASQPEPVDVGKLRTEVAEAAAREGRRIVDQALGLAKAGKAGDALAQLARDIAAQPGLFEPRLLQISLLLSEKRLDEAQRAADSAAAAFPREPDAVYHQATVAMIRGDLPRAEAAFEHTLELVPTHVPALNNLAVILLQHGDLAGGRALLDRVLAIDPGNTQARENLSRLPPPKR